VRGSEREEKKERGICKAYTYMVSGNSADRLEEGADFPFYH
jgi:hypothetical protein